VQICLNCNKSSRFFAVKDEGLADNRKAPCTGTIGEVKLNLMKEIAAEHNIEWDSIDFEAELLKAPEKLFVRNIAIVLPPCPHITISLCSFQIPEQCVSYYLCTF
jgi:hypothetical protein